MTKLRNKESAQPESIADRLDGESSSGPGPGRPSINDEILGGHRDELVWFLSVTWADVGWQIEHASTTEELRQAFEPIKNHSSSNLVVYFLRPVSATASASDVRAAKEALKVAIKANRGAQTEHDLCLEAARMVELAMNQAGADPSQSLQAELLKRWGESAKTRRELEVARTNFKYLEAQFADNAAYFSQNELLDFIKRKKYARHPLGLANAMAGLPDMGWEQSHARCARIGYQQWPTFPFRVFRQIESIWKRSDAYPTLSLSDLFHQEVGKIPKTEVATNPETGKRFKQENHLRSYLANNWRSLRLAIEEAAKQQLEDPGQIPFLISSAFTRNLEKPRTPQDSVLDRQERIR
jgi:hypothetical protein